MWRWRGTNGEVGGGGADAFAALASTPAKLCAMYLRTVREQALPLAIAHHDSRTGQVPSTQ